MKPYRTFGVPLATRHLVMYRTQCYIHLQADQPNHQRDEHSPYAPSGTYNTKTFYIINTIETLGDCKTFTKSAGPAKFFELAIFGMVEFR